MFRLILLLLCALAALSGCAPQSASPQESSASSSCWSPPSLPTDPPSGEAASALDALRLCEAFAADLTASFPDFAPTLSAEDISYYEARLSDPDADADALSSELAITIRELRWQVFNRIESAAKSDRPLPDGLEETLKSYEQLFLKIGW